MKCQRCHQNQVISITAKCSDLCFVNYPDGREHYGYVPEDIGPIGSGDYIEFSYCLNCGQVQTEDDEEPFPFFKTDLVNNDE